MPASAPSRKRVRQPSVSLGVSNRTAHGLALFSKFVANYGKVAAVVEALWPITARGRSVL